MAIYQSIPSVGKFKMTSSSVSSGLTTGLISQTRYRYIILALCVTATLIEYSTRTNINNALVSMTHHVGHKNESKSKPFCPLPKSIDGKVVHHVDGIETFDWTPPTQGLILGSFFYGYIWLQIPAGRMAELFGAKWVVGFAILSSGIINLMTPILAHWGVGALIASRVLLGLVQGGVFPACFATVTQWFAPSEKSFAFGLVNVGGNLGAVAAASLTGLMSHNVGWPYSFYTIGTVAVAWTFLWVAVIRKPPSSDQKVLKDEMENDNQSNTSEDSEQSESSRPPVPWLKILTNRAFIAAVITRFGASFAYLTLQTKIPGYLKDIQHVSDSTVSDI